MERTRLCLKRLSGQSFWVGDARVNLVVHGKAVKVTIEANKDTRIVRDELRVRAA